MKKRIKKVYDDDDGRVIAPMNVDGMPWASTNTHAQPESESEKGDNDQIQLTPKEQRAMMGGVLAASLLVTGAFILAGFLFILFCVGVWLR